MRLTMADGDGHARDLRPEFDAAVATLRASLAPAPRGASAAENHDAAVHRARRAIKTLRALLRLVPADTSGLDRSLRDVARRLAPARDQHVLSRTALALARRVGDADVAGVLRAVAAEAEAEVEARTARSRAAPRLAALALTLSALTTDVPVRDLAATVSRLFRKAKRALARALAARDDEALHDARTLVVRLQLQLTALRRLGGRTPGRRVAALDRLRDVLGDHHDLALLAAVVAARPGTDPGLARRTARILRHAMRQLERAAGRLAERAFDVAPGTLRRRMTRQLAPGTG